MPFYRIAYRGFSYVEASSPKEAVAHWNKNERMVDLVTTEKPEEVKDLGAFECLFEEEKHQ